jgi:hypothetical protein
MDPKNGDIRLYYLTEDGNSKVLYGHSALEEHVWEGIPAELQADANIRIRTLLSR